MNRSTGRPAQSRSHFARTPQLGKKMLAHVEHRPDTALERLEGRLMLSSMQMNGAAGCGCGACAAAAQSLQDSTTEPTNLPVVVNMVARSNAANARMFQPLSALPAARGRVSHLPLDGYAPLSIDHARLTNTLAGAP